MAADPATYWPSDGERVVITRTVNGMPCEPVIGVATDIMPYHQDDLGTWVGGWNIRGKYMFTGREEWSSNACSEMIARYNGHIVQTVRPATEEEWQRVMG